MDVYLFQAALWCEDCIRNMLIDEHPDVLVKWPDYFSGGAHLISTEDILREVVNSHGRDYDNEHTWDSDEFPKGPVDDGGGEADSQQHCDCCHVFLENPLTEEGYKYVIDSLRDHDGDSEVEELWRKYYGQDYYKGKPVVEYVDSEEVEEDCNG